MKSLVLGIGSPLADDRLGFLVVDELSKDHAMQALVSQGSLELKSADRPGLNLLYYLEAAYCQILLVDMVRTNLNQLGNIYRLQGSEIIGFSGMLSSHNLGVSHSLALANSLNMDIKRIKFWGVEGLSTEINQELNLGLIPAILQVTQEIKKLLGGHEQL